jgi:hypothetical protein
MGSGDRLVGRENAIDRVDDEFRHPEQGKRKKRYKNSRNQAQNNDGASRLPDKIEDGRHVAECRKPFPPSLPEFRLFRHGLPNTIIADLHYVDPNVIADVLVAPTKADAPPQHSE